MYEYIHNRRKVPTETHPALVPKQDDRKKKMEETTHNSATLHRSPLEKTVVLFFPPISRPGVLHLGSGLLPPFN